MEASPAKGLYQLLIELTGLAPEVVEAELSVLMKRLNVSAESMTTEDMRKLMVVYLEDFHSKMSLRLAAPSLSQHESEREPVRRMTSVQDVGWAQVTLQEAEA